MVHVCTVITIHIVEYVQDQANINAQNVIVILIYTMENVFPVALLDILTIKQQEHVILVMILAILAIIN